MDGILRAQSHRPVLLVREHEAATHLRRHLAIEIGTLRSSLEAGYAEAAMATANNVASSFGTRLWDGTIRHLRDQLNPHGWMTERPGGLEVVRRPDNRLQITACLAAGGVGDEYASPAPAHPRGWATGQAIGQNQLALDLGAAGGAIETWWLMYVPDPVHGEIRAELALPQDFDGHGFASYAVRVFLPLVTLNAPATVDLTAAANEDREPEVVVRRRT